MKFGEVYIKSCSKGYFWARNNTKKAIAIELIYGDQELAQSYKKPQVIPSGGEAGFLVAFSKDTLGDFRSTIKYRINGQHEFEMSITAKCVPVCIEVDRPNIKFMFDEGSVDMSTKEVVKLFNPGNSDAVFKFTLAKEKLYIPEILEGKLGAKQTLEVPINFTVP